MMMMTMMLFSRNRIRHHHSTYRHHVELVKCKIQALIYYGDHIAKAFNDLYLDVFLYARACQLLMQFLGNQCR